MYGAIFGDIIGSRFEFDQGGKTKDFELFTNKCDWTDDTVMTVAIMEALMNAGKVADVETIRKKCIESMQKWGQKYPYAGYGSSFINWVHAKNPKPYNSFGNGSAMRVSAAGWIYDTVERTREVAKATAEVSHNHPEGIKGAECTAAVMFLARTGIPKEEIKEYVIKEFGYDFSKTVDELRPLHEHVEWCQDSLPKALVSFFEGDSYEDVVRNAVSLGGDTDTLAAIAGAMADAMYGVPLGMIPVGTEYLEPDMLDTIDRFGSFIKDEPNPYEINKYIKEAAEVFAKERSEDNLYKLFDALLGRMMEDGEVPEAMIDVNRIFETLDVMNMTTNETFSFEREMRLRIDTVSNKEGVDWIPLYTDHDEIHSQSSVGITMNVPIYRVLKCGLADDVEGIVINPFGLALSMPKAILKIVVAKYEQLKGITEVEKVISEEE